MFNQIFSIIAPIILIILIGYVFGRTIPVEVRQLTDVSLYIFTSALVFSTLIHTQIPTTAILMMGTAMVMLMVVLAFIAILYGKIKRFSPDFISATLLCTLFVNSGNMGLPFNFFAYGQVGLEIASLYVLFNAVLTNSLGVFIAARGRESTWSAVTTVFKMPLIYAVALAMVIRFFHIQKPQFFFRAVELLQQGCVPLLLIILGIQISKTRIAKNWHKLAGVLFLRLLISPALTFLICRLLGINGLLLKVIIIQSAMPVAISSIILAIKFDTRPNYVANVVVVSTLASILTLSLILLLLETFL